MASQKLVVRIFLSLSVICLCMPSAVRAAEDPNTSVTEIPIFPANQLLSFAVNLQKTQMDCTHLVHYLYQRFGLDYVYADSISLYEGVSEFRRVKRPQAGDVIVWPGHAGIVVDPEQHTFLSALRSGVKMSSYVSSYWKRKGTPRFLHYAGDSTSIESSPVD